MPAALANDICITAQTTNKRLYNTALEVAVPRMAMRRGKVMEMPKIQRHAFFAKIFAYPQMEALTFNLLSNWLVEKQVDMLVLWLDTLGIPHNGKGCADNFPFVPDAAKLSEGIAKLLEKYDPWLVKLYLVTFNEIDETHWPELNRLINENETLQNAPVPEGMPGLLGATAPAAEPAPAS
ncbi:hypothetical protein DB346_17675 [Verrucomicrobia bacterium LW23]|nr:hypothetical protein DB346_17675 [Verrucomicrobia bacterium LW23]